jgi:hypothetical protein
VWATQSIAAADGESRDGRKGGCGRSGIGEELNLTVGISVEVASHCRRRASKINALVGSEAEGAAATDSIQGQSGAPGDYSGSLPPADDFVEPARSIVGDKLFAADGQVIDKVAGDLMRGVELRISFAGVEIVRVAEHLRCARDEIAVVVGDYGTVVDGVRISVVKIQLKVVGQTLTQGQKHGVVGGVAFVGAQGVDKELRGDDHVGRHEAEDAQGHAADVALLQSGLIQGVDRLRAGVVGSAEDLLIDLRAGQTSSGLELIFEEGQRSDVGGRDILVRQIFQHGGIASEGVLGGWVSEIDQLGASASTKSRRP